MEVKLKALEARNSKAQGEGRAASATLVDIELKFSPVRAKQAVVPPLQG
jgi:hypothetical protein